MIRIFFTALLRRAASARDKRGHGAGLAAAEFCRPFGVEGFDTFLEVIRLPQPAVAMAFELDSDSEG